MTIDFAGATEGVLEVLSVGRGDIRLEIRDGDKAQIDKAKRIIKDMTERGYAIFVETEPGKPLTRVKRFNPRHMTYIINGDTGEEKELPATKTKATAVGRTSGG